VTRLTDSSWLVGSPAWSPDGTKIAFDGRVESGNEDLCVVNADGSRFTRLTTDPARDYGPAWKPDGSLLAFATTRFGSDEITLLDPGNGSVSRIGTGLIGSQPAWSPDGIRIAYVTSNINCSDFVAIIRTDDWSGNGVTCGQHPAWHP
jgi:Tol biopolymer transport system component